MHARVTTFQIRPDRVDEGVRILRESAPEVRDQPGFKEGVLLLDRERSAGMTVMLWEDERAIEASADFARGIFARVGDAIASQPERQTFEVLEHRPGAGRKFARVSNGTMSSRAFEDMRTRRDTSIIDAASKQPGYAGFLILVNPSSRNLIGMSFWDSEEHLKASEGAGGYYNREMEKTRDDWEGGWSRAVYEVAAEV